MTKKSKFKKISKWYKKLSIKDKRLFWSIIGTTMILLLFIFSIEAVGNYNDKISQEECDSQHSEKISYALSLQEENPILAFMYTYNELFVVFIVLIGVSWVLHGVGFHIVKR